AIIAIVALIALFTDNEKVKSFKEGLEDAAAELNRQIREKEDYCAWLAKEIDSLRNQEGYLKAKAVRLYRICQYIILGLLFGITAIIYLFTSYGLHEALLAVVGVAAVLGSSITFIVFNEIGNYNRLLSVIREGLVNLEFRRNNFEPAMIYLLEDKLKSESALLEELKNKRKEFMP
ncbi:MAG TPA: hypothetical protein VNY73_01065, partial [Bacteroidia bacterium]|nr:hypothetical protein [Bacteroidia bacterium]